MRTLQCWRRVYHGLDVSRGSRRVDGNDPRAIDRTDLMSRGNAPWHSFVRITPARMLGLTIYRR